MLMERKAAEFFWNLPIKGRKHSKKVIIPPEVAYYTNNVFGGIGGKPNWIPTTWEDVHRERTKKIRNNLHYKRRFLKIKPCLIFVFYNNTTFFGGWWIYIKTLKKEFALNFRASLRTDERYKGIIVKIMNLYPCGIIPLYDNIYHWCEIFSKSYPSSSFSNRKKQGIKFCFCLLDEYDELINVASDHESLNGDVTSKKL